VRNYFNSCFLAEKGRNMNAKLTWELALAVSLSCSTQAYADSNDDPCAGPLAFLSIVDRPSIGDSVCTVANKKGALELGIQAQKIYPGRGYQYNLPEAELRLGLPAHTELIFLLPNYVHQSVSPHTGYTASVIGMKHRVSSSENLQTAIESLLTLPTGSSNFGSHGLGVEVSAIASYTATPSLNLTFILGVATQSQSTNAGGQHSTSVNPDVIASWSLSDKTDLYVEVYGQSKTGPGQGSGFSSDAGIVYLALANLTVDAEVGQRISGTTGGFSHYIGTGMAIAF
jgi:hypothetical protein